MPSHSFPDEYFGYSYDTAKDNHVSSFHFTLLPSVVDHRLNSEQCVQPKSVISFDNLYQDFNTDPIDPVRTSICLNNCFISLYNYILRLLTTRSFLL